MQICSADCIVEGAMPTSSTPTEGGVMNGSHNIDHYQPKDPSYMKNCLRIQNRCASHLTFLTYLLLTVYSI